MELSRVPPRILIALVLTVLAVAVLGVRTVIDRDTGGGAAEGSTTTTADPTPTDAPVEASTTSVEVLPDWFPKQTSRYSEREPVVSLTTVPTTTSTVLDDGPG